MRCGGLRAGWQQALGVTASHPNGHPNGHPNCQPSQFVHPCITCLQCEKHLRDNGCEACDETGQCTRCTVGSSFLRNGACAPCDALTDGCSSCTRKGKCRKCRDGYTLRGKRCVPCTAFGRLCAACSKWGRCLRCQPTVDDSPNSPTVYLSKGICKQVNKGDGWVGTGPVDGLWQQAGSAGALGTAAFPPLHGRPCSPTHTMLFAVPGRLQGMSPRRQLPHLRQWIPQDAQGRQVCAVVSGVLRCHAPGKCGCSTQV